jgi:phytoene dehydrogenase-like protein
MDYDALIVGGGISGLSLGALLAKKGYKILLCEQNTILGGRACILEKDGYNIDYGIHSNRFASEGKVAELFDALGDKLQFNESHPPLIFKNGKFYNMSKGVSQILRTKLLGVSGKLAVLKVFKRLLSAKPHELFDMTLSNWLKNITDKKEVVDLIKVYASAGITCPDIEKASAGEFVLFVQKAVKSKETAGYPKGGWKTIIESLAKHIRDNNGLIMLGSKVQKLKIEKESGDKSLKIKNAVVNNKTMTSKVYVCATHPKQLFELIGKDCFAPDFVKYIENIEPTAGISIDFCLSKKVTDIKNLILTIDPPTMGYFTSNIDPSVAPEGKQIGTWYYPLSHDVVKDKKRMEQEASKLKDLLSKMFPNIWSYLEWERTMFLETVDGAIPKPTQTLKDRVDFHSSTVDNLFFVGDTTKGEGWGGDIAFDSAMKCANEIEKYLKGTK